MATTNTRADLHHILDELPDALLEETGLYLQALRDGDRLMLKLLSAPYDDPLPDEIEALAESDNNPNEEVVADEDLDRELGW